MGTSMKIVGFVPNGIVELTVNLVDLMANGNMRIG